MSAVLCVMALGFILGCITMVVFEVIMTDKEN